ncbi:MAG: OadG family protein [Lachnospiraceae bacterium]|nr:OadG family protein [Lachnospiraceae bacterium]
MKKILAILCMVTCIFSLTACGATEEASQMDVAKESTAKKLAVDYIAPYYANTFMDDEIAQQFIDNFTIAEAAYITETQFMGVAQSAGYDTLAFDGEGVKSAIRSFQDAGKKMGPVQSYDTENVTVKRDKTTITVNVPVVCEKKSGSIEVIFSTKRFLSVDTVSINADMTTAEIGEKAGLNTLLGMGTVFIVLILIMIIIYCFNIFAVIEKKKAAKAKNNDKAPAQAPVSAPVAEDLTDDLELVAVISAAIAASEGAVSTDGFVVRSIRRAR